MEVLSKEEIVRLLRKSKATKTEIVNRRPNSFQFRYAGTASDVKIYFEDVKDLVKQLEEFSKNMENIKQEVDKIKETNGGE